MLFMRTQRRLVSRGHTGQSDLWRISVGSGFEPRSDVPGISQLKKPA